tara:strand:+ start:589 stop:894 length:306 start_codon:yes stop_codon:yes gene_type:complete
MESRDVTVNLEYLPRRAYTNDTKGITVEVRRGEMGYFLFTDCDMNPKLMNDSIGVSQEEADIMIAGSMFGWDTPLVQDYNNSQNDGSGWGEDNESFPDCLR